MVWIIVLVLIFVAALNWAFRAEASLRRFASWAIAVLLAICVAASAAGWFHAEQIESGGSASVSQSIHYRLGLVLSFALTAFLPVPVALGVRLMVAGRYGHAALQIFASIGTYCFSLLARATGYLGPSHLPYGGQYGEETLNRFRVWHLVGMPLILMGLLAGWLILPWWSRRRAIRRSDAIPATGEDSDNPYQSPSIGVWATGGRRIMGRTQRIRRGKPQPTEIPMNDIRVASVQFQHVNGIKTANLETMLCWTKFLNLIPLAPNSIAICTSEGKQYRFVLFGRKDWKLAIDALSERNDT